MAKRQSRLDKIEEDIRIRKRETPFREGIYAIRHPFFLFIRPRLILKFNRTGTKIKGQLWWMRRRKKLEVIKFRQKQLVISFKMDIIQMDMVLYFTEPYNFRGFIDTPIGHINVTGHYLDYSHGEL